MKKLGLLLSALALVVVLAACGGDSEIDTYLSENEETLTSIFENFGMGEFELTTSGDNELVASFETTADSYESMENTSAIMGLDSVGETFAAFIDDVYSVHMYDLANAITNETELDSATVRIIVSFDGEELTNITFDSQ